MQRMQFVWSARKQMITTCTSFIIDTGIVSFSHQPCSLWEAHIVNFSPVKASSLKSTFLWKCSTSVDGGLLVIFKTICQIKINK